MDNETDKDGWREAAKEYHRARNGRVLIVETEPEKLARLRELMGDDVSLERAYWQINEDAKQGRAATSTVEALMFSLRERGVAALKERDTRRLSELSNEQLVEVGRRCKALKLGRGPWSNVEVEVLMRLRQELHNGR